MANEDRTSIERFRVQGNVLKLTDRFDPRYQSRAGMEMMNIVSSLAEESGEPEVVLDISEASALPSMLIGMLCEARDLTGKVGKRLKIRVKTATYNRLESLGLAKMFSTPSRSEGEYKDLEIMPTASAPSPDEERR
jgi:Anti-anti-sigma regulatory factor (antagonist of anti-sigma factor)